MVQGIASAYGGWNWLSSMGGVGRGCGFFSLVMLGVPDVRERAPWLAERKGEEEEVWDKHASIAWVTLPHKCIN